jgi:flagellar biosynthesis anti-sigma factor FlgM
VKISNEAVPPEFRAESAAGKTSARNSQSGSDPVVLEDSAEVSDVGRLAARLQDDSTAKIEQLRAKVSGGNYSVDAGKLSGKIVDSLLSE